MHNSAIERTNWIDRLIMTELVSCQKEQSSETRVLLVDDNEAFSAVITRQLEMMGCAVHATPHASAFFSKLMTTQEPYDLAVIDIHLPGLNGDQVISWLQRSERSDVHSLPVLIVTGLPFEQPEALMIDDTSVIMLSKPFTYQQLKSAVDRLLARGGLH